MNPTGLVFCPLDGEIEPVLEGSGAFVTGCVVSDSAFVGASGCEAEVSASGVLCSLEPEGGGNATTAGEFSSGALWGSILLSVYISPDYTACVFEL